MAKTVSFIYCTYLLTTLMYHFSHGEIESTINHCCSLGNSIALRDQHCNGISISTPVRGVAPETQSVCFSAMQLCCVHDLRTLQCEEGKEAAKLGRSCPDDNTDRKLCCEACKLGIISASMRVDCISEDINFGCPWNSAFAACCSAHDFQTLDSNNYTAVQSNDHQVVADHNICDLYPGELCAHICVPMLSSYICRCHEGFTLMADGKTCNQNVENRCVTNNPCQHKCQDTGVSIECTCDKGYRLHSNKTSCIDIDECAEELHYCSPYETCHNEPGRFSCEQIKDIEVPSTTGTDSTTLSTSLYNDTKGCPFGYAMSRELRKCVDVNECQENIHVCQTETEDCVNIQGGYNCVNKQIKKPVQQQQCNTGFHWDSSAGTCLDINECADVSGDSPCDSNQICENIVGSYRCLCKTGYQLDSLTQACVDINECQVDLHNCLPSQRCDNTIGSFQCVRYTNCGTGYTLNAQTGICEDDDECALKIDNCRYLGSDFICRNTLGSFRCEKQGKENCDGKCASQKNFTQKCPRGFQLNPNGQCEDINECEKGLARCGPNQRCINIQGAYTCSSALNCESGFRINEGRTQCVDIDECTEQQRICDHSCINLWGSYRCSCRTGYKLHEDNRTCVDINECEIYKDRRLCMGYCVNQPGSHSCQCPQGYILGNDLSSCIDIDECKDGKLCKGQDQACLNMRGSYRCNSIACPPGYVKDSAHENKCKKASTGCREDDAECIQQPLAYTFYFIALVSNYSIPAGGLDFFTMRGPLRASTSVDFGLNLKSAQTPPGVPPATKDYFDLPHTGHNQVSIKLMQSLLGPQDITLELTMTFYFNGIFGGKTVSRIGLFVSQYEF